MKIPPRKLFSEDELRVVEEVFRFYWDKGVDFGYQGEFENRYTKAFSKFQGGGYADAVSSGTAALYVALAALELKEKSQVIVSPVTDPGGVTPVIALGHTLSIADSQKGGFNMDPVDFENRITENTSAVVLTHLGGLPANVDEIVGIARQKNVKVIEDCSQAHGATYKGINVGCFGDIAIFSTMFSKNHASGGCGGIIYTRDKVLSEKVRAYADRGKAFFSEDFNPKNPAQALFPALNFNQDEISCAIGESTLKKLPNIIVARRRLADVFAGKIDDCSALEVLKPVLGSVPSYFFLTIKLLEPELIKIKKDFTTALIDDGLWINPEYRFVVSEWPAVAPWISGNSHTPNAVSMKDESFNLLFHENMTVSSILKFVDSIVENLLLFGFK